MDDILVGGRDVDDHDRILQKVVDRATHWNLSMNFVKCQIRKNRVSYVGHMITEHGLEPSRDKVPALTEMAAPTSKEEVRRFLGMIQYLAKFIPDLSAKDAPLRQLLKKEVGFHWSRAQQESFRTLKDCCSKAPVLAQYDKDKKLTIQCDTSSTALGGVLMQDGRPVAYTSWALTQTEQGYVQIEKETLAIVHSCKKFHVYIFSRPVKGESDHKPLRAIFAKALAGCPNEAASNDVAAAAI